MAIRLTTDLGAPALVALADIVTSEKKPTWNRPLGIAICLAGYLVGGVMGVGGDFLKQMGVGSLDWAAGSLYAYTKDVTPSRVTNRARSRVSGYPAQPKNGYNMWPQAV